MTDQPRLNVQFIDSARNATYDVFSAVEEDFRLIFPRAGQDIEFMDLNEAFAAKIKAETGVKSPFSNSAFTFSRSASSGIQNERSNLPKRLSPR